MKTHSRLVEQRQLCDNKRWQQSEEQATDYTISIRSTTNRKPKSNERAKKVFFFLSRRAKQLTGTPNEKKSVRKHKKKKMLEENRIKMCVHANRFICQLMKTEKKGTRKKKYKLFSASFQFTPRWTRRKKNITIFTHTEQ